MTTTRHEKTNTGMASAVAARSSTTDDQAGPVPEAMAEQAPDRPITGAGDSLPLRERPLCSHLTAETIRGAVLDALFEDADEEAELVAGFRVRLRELIADTDRAVFISLFDAEPQVTPAFDQFRSELLQCMPAPQDARSEQFGR